MKKAIIRTVLFVIVSGLALKVSAQDKNNSVSIKRNYPAGISEHMRSRLDSTVCVSVKRFNAEKHPVSISTLPEEGSVNIEVTFTPWFILNSYQMEML